MLSSSVVCFSFTILNIFENEKGVIKILVYSFVIDINQIEGIFATIITGGWGRFVYGASRVLIKLLQIFHKYGICSLPTGNTVLVLSRSGAFVPHF